MNQKEEVNYGGCWKRIGILEVAMSNHKYQNQTHTELFEKKIWYMDDVLAFTQYSRKTIYNLVSLGEIPHQKQRKRLVFIPQEILNWIFKGK